MFRLSLRPNGPTGCRHDRTSRLQGRNSRLLLSGIVCLLCLLGASCKGESGNPPPVGSIVSAVDVFSKPAPRPPKSRALRLLVAGDSLSISLGEQLEHTLSGAPGIDFSRDGTRSTGLTRPELLDWPVRLRERVAEEAPDVVVIMIGANDVMPLVGPDGSHIYFDNPDWPKAYAAKAREMVDICRAANPRVKVYWVGVPAMGEPALAAGVKQVNAALKAMCAATPACTFVNTQAAFADPKGNFSRHGRDGASGDALLLRTADGVHMTDSGAKLLAGVVLDALAHDKILPPNAGVDELRSFAHDVRPVAETAEAKTPAPQPAPPKVKPGRQVYVVRKGDTILVIAKRLGIAAADLAAVNPGVDSSRLALGQALRLPARHK